jgi:hypothetical protein
MLAKQVHYYLNHSASPQVLCKKKKKKNQYEVEKASLIFEPGNTRLNCDSVNKDSRI